MSNASQRFTCTCHQMSSLSEPCPPRCCLSYSTLMLCSPRCLRFPYLICIACLGRPLRLLSSRLLSSRLLSTRLRQSHPCALPPELLQLPECYAAPPAWIAWAFVCQLVPNGKSACGRTSLLRHASDAMGTANGGSGTFPATRYTKGAPMGDTSRRATLVDLASLPMSGHQSTLACRLLAALRRSPRLQNGAHGDECRPEREWLRIVTTTTEWDQMNGTSQLNHGPLLARAMSTRPFSTKEAHERCKTVHAAMNAVRNKNGHHLPP